MGITHASNEHAQNTGNSSKFCSVCELILKGMRAMNTPDFLVLAN